MQSGAASATPYARALFELASERGQAEAVGRELDGVAALVAGDAALRELLARPWVAAAAKASVALEIAARAGLSPLTRDFLGLVARAGRADRLEAIAGAYRGMADAAAGRVRARVRTAVALSPGERETLGQRLGAAMGGRQVLLEEDVDPSMLGGFVAEIGSYIVDGSLDGQLARLRERLARG